MDSKSNHGHKYQNLAILKSIEMYRRNPTACPIQCMSNDELLTNGALVDRRRFSVNRRRTVEWGSDGSVKEEIAGYGACTDIAGGLDIASC